MTDPRGKEPYALSRRHRNHPLAAQTRLGFAPIRRMERDDHDVLADLIL
jgi:hypothetical protein